MSDNPNGSRINTSSVSYRSSTSHSTTQISGDVWRWHWWVPVVKQDDWGTIYKNNHGLIQGATYSYDSIARTGGNITKPHHYPCLLYTSPSPRDRQKSRMPSSA